VAANPFGRANKVNGVDQENSTQNSTQNEVLMGLGARPGADMTARLLLALTALYTQKAHHSQEEQRHYEELALRLIERVDAATRTTVAGILQGYGHAPIAILRRLGVAPPAAEEGTAPAESVVATVSESQPAASPPPEQAAHPAEPNPIASLPTEDAPSPAELGDAFFAAPSAERRRLLSLLPPETLDLSADEPERQNAGSPFAALDAAALEGRIGQFFREFERCLAIPRSLCERIVNDPSGEPMVVAARASDMPIAVLQRVLLLVNAAVGRSVQRVYDLTALYHDLDRGAAIKLLALWRAQAKPDAAPTQPIENKAGQRELSAAALRSRFGALAARVKDQAVNPRPGQGSFARRDLRSR
jgi:hypothetical protein